MIPDEPKRPVETTESSFKILELLHANDGLTLDELDKELPLARSTIHRHLLTLENLGAVRRMGREFDIGLRFLELGFYAQEKEPLYDLGRDYVERLADEVDATVWLMTHENGLCVYLHKADAENSFQPFAETGGRQPMHIVAGGKAMLAHLSQETVERVIERHGLPSQTPHTITDRESLFREFEQIRERGYAVNREESIRGVRAIGAPINADEKAYGAVSISAAANRLNDESIEQSLAEALLTTKNEIEIAIRYG